MATTAPSPGFANSGFRSTDPELAAVDLSVRGPVMICLLTGVHWMVVGTFLLVYASSLAHPQDTFPILGWFVTLSEHCSFFTFGRVWPAAIDALVYGWGCTAGFGLAIWLMCRMCRVPAVAAGALLTGVIVWNVGVALGLSFIFIGWSNSVELLEFPGFVNAVLWLAYILIALSITLTFLARKPGAGYIAQSWLLAALFAFAWLFAAGSIMLSSRQPLPGSNVIQELLSAWYVHGLYTLWLAPLGLALLYYLIPKMSGMPIQFNSKVSLAFWTWIIIAPWTAVHDLVGGPFPADTVTVGLVLSGLIFLPVALIGLNLVGTCLKGEQHQGHHGGVVFPFLMLASVLFVVAGLSEQLLSIRSVNEYLRFTMFRECNMLLWVYGFFSFVVFGAIYYIVPRLLDFGWRSSLLIRIHYYCSLYGICLVIAFLGLGGVMQGITLENPNPNVGIGTADEVALSFTIATTMCLSLISLGNGVFALHLGWMFLHWFRLRVVRRNRLVSELLMEPYEEEPQAEAVV